MSFINFADIEELYLKDKQLRREDVCMLSEWQLMQPHLPAPLHPIETALFLHSCFYSIEASKHCIDAYYTFRTYCPEIFANRDPFSPEMQLGLSTFGIIALPNFTPEGYGVVYGHLLDLNPDACNWNTMMKIGDMVASLCLKRHGCRRGYIGVINLKGATISHLLKCNVKMLQTGLSYLQNALPVRVQSIHFVNSVPFMDKVMALIKPFLGKKFKDMLHVHYGQNETIFEFIPKHQLPIECGGESFSSEEFYRNIGRKDIESHAEFFAVEERQLADESKRPSKYKINLDLSGIQGTFKKLDVD